MGDDSKSCRRIDCGACLAPLWIMGWLFTIGWLGLSFWKAVLAILIWPYYVGAALK